VANKVWVFDLDGTLMNSDFYKKPAEEAYAEIMRALGDKSPSFAEIKSRHNDFDKAMIYVKNPSTGKLYLYSKQRFPTSLVKFYEMLCKEAGAETDFSLMRKLYNIGLKAFKEERYIRKIKAQAFTVAKFLKGKGDTLLVLTKGDKRVQGDKRRALKKAGLLKYFDDFIIAPDSKYGFFKLIRSRYKGDAYYSIGDTYADDILPAIKAGYFGVYIPFSLNWKEIGKFKRIERRRSKKNSNRYDNLVEIAEKYDHL
jgi:FMN phosphatase YigB (HAD superfamily)